MSNNERTSLKYEKRKYYKYAYFTNVDNVIDFWETSRYYGVLDTKAIPVYLNKNYLKSVSTASTTNLLQKQSLLNIVSDSFKEMNQEFKSADQALAIPKSVYNPINIKKSCLLFEDEYTTFLTSILDTWFNATRNKILSDVTNFDEFLSLFISLNTKLFDPILTQTAYITSYVSSPLISGLIAELSTEKHDQDSKKISNFIFDKNFDFFVNTAAKYSFMVDKNAPWRLVFNLSTEYALNKMNQYGIENLEQLFEQYYIYPHLTEYKVLRDKLVNYYVTKVNKKPTTQITTYCPITKSLKFETVTKNIDTEKSDLFWIQMYYYIRCKEEKLNLSQSQFNANLKIISMIYNTYGETETLNWILDKTKKFIDGGTNPTYSEHKAVSQIKNNNFVSYTFTI